MSADPVSADATRADAVSAGPSPDVAPALTAAALRFWHTERTLLLQGLVHALSNRVGTLVAVGGMLDPTGAGGAGAGVAVGILQGEVERLERLLGDFRALAGESAPVGGAVEPLHLPTLAAGAAALHAHHPRAREVPCTVALPATLPPARGHPDAVTQALLLALAAVAPGASAVRVSGALDGAHVALRVAGEGRPPAPDAAGWAAECGGWLLAASRGSAAAEGGAVLLALPTLAAALRPAASPEAASGAAPGGSPAG